MNKRLSPQDVRKLVQGAVDNLDKHIKKNKRLVVSSENEDLKKDYNRKLQIFYQIEALVNGSNDPGITFKDHESEWQSLGKELSYILNQVAHTEKEALEGFKT